MRITFRDRPVVFVDVEASGLDVGSYPIEIGWSADDEREPESFLVRPADDWRETDAYEAGFDVHGIPYASLMTAGMHLLDLPKRLDDGWKDAILVSDAAAQDGAWIERAYDAIDRRSPWRLIEFDAVFGALCQQAGFTLEQGAAILNAAEWTWPTPHRAGPDAQRLNKTCRAVVDPAFRAAIGAT